MSDKPILCLDFDGVIHSYTSGWKGADVIPDAVTEGFFEWAERAAQHFRLVIYSSRSKEPAGIAAMQAWFVEQRRHWREYEGGKHTIEAPLELEFATEKPAAFLTIDDRGLTFNGNWRDEGWSPKRLLDFRPWYRRMDIIDTVLPPVYAEQA